MTWAVGFRVYVSEIQSPKTRAGATSLALSANWTVNWVVALVTPVLLARSRCAVYFVFAGVTAMTVVVCMAWMPETGGGGGGGGGLEAIQEGLGRGRDKRRLLVEGEEGADGVRKGVVLGGEGGRETVCEECGNEKARENPPDTTMTVSK